MQKVVVIGAGNIGTLHASVYQEMEDAQLIGVCDIDHARADKLAATHKVPAYYDVPSMLRQAKPTMVSVATGGFEYGSDHYQPVMQAAKARVHILCEKPICNEIPQAIEMVKAAKENEVCFGVDLNHRFTPAAQLAKQWVDEDRIGHQLFMNMSMWIMNPRETSPWFQIKALHPHTVDIMRYYCGDITQVQCFATKAPGRTIWSTAQFNMTFASGALGHLTGSYDIQRGHPMERCEVAGVKGRFVVDDMFRQATLYPAGDSNTIVYNNPIFGGMRDFSDTFRNRLGRFVQQLNQGALPNEIDGSGADALAAQKVLAGAIESIKTQSIVRLDKMTF